MKVNGQPQYFGPAEFSLTMTLNSLGPIDHYYGLVYAKILHSLIKI